MEPWRPAPVMPVASTYLPRAAVSDAHIVIAWILTACTLGYLLPWAIAATRRKSNSAAIGLLTFFVGWTMLGWVVALVMSCMAEPVHPVFMGIAAPSAYAPQLSTPPGWYPDGAGAQRYWDGMRWTGHVTP